MEGQVPAPQVLIFHSPNPQHPPRGATSSQFTLAAHREDKSLGSSTPAAGLEIGGRILLGLSSLLGAAATAC